MGTGGTIGSGQEPVRVNNLTPRFHRPPLKRGLLIYLLLRVVGQVAHFNLTPEAFLCRVFNFLPFVLSGSTEEPDLHTAIVSVR